MATIILGNPVRGPIHPLGWKRPAGNADFRLTAPFGRSTNTAEPKVVWPGGDGIPAGTYPLFHQGVDLGNGGCGAAVIAMAAGVVDEARVDGAGVRRVILRHGRFRTWYGHLEDEIVSVGQSIALGQGLGHVGKSGATQCHLHVGLECLDCAAVTASKGKSIWHNKFIDPWRRLAINVTVRPKGPGINIRTQPGSGSTLGPIYATTRDDGHVYRADGADIALTETMERWGGQVTGATYTTEGVDGQPITGNRWDLIWFDGAYRVIATPLVVRSI